MNQLLRFGYVYMTILLTLSYPNYRLFHKQNHWKIFCLSIPLFLFTECIHILVPVYLMVIYVDLKYKEIPYYTLIVFLICSLSNYQSQAYLYTIGIGVFGYIMAYQSWIGLGDIHLLMIWALSLGSHIFYVTWIASLLCLLLHTKKEFHQEIPFGPYLCIAYLCVLLIQR